MFCPQQCLYLQKENNSMKQTIINKLREFFTLQPVERYGFLALTLVGKNQKKVILIYLSVLTRSANVTLFKYISIVNALQSLLRKKIDLVEEGQLKDFAKDSAEQDKILIYERKA